MNISIISMWTRYEVPPSCQFDSRLLLKPLREYNRYNATRYLVSACHYGRIDEFPEEYLLVITWKSHKDYESFRESKAWEEMLGAMQSYSEKVPDTRVFDHGRIMWYTGLGDCKYLGVKFVYFPKSISVEKREELEGIKSVRSNLHFGAGDPRNWLATHATRCWAEGLHTYKGEEALAYLWCHKWRNKERQQNYNSGRNNNPKMAYLNHQLMGLAPLGWEDFHVHLQSWIDITWSDEELGEDEEDDDDEDDEDDEEDEDNKEVEDNK